MGDNNDSNRNSIINGFLEKFKEEAILNKELNSKFKLKDKKIAKCRLKWIEQYNALEHKHKITVKSLKASKQKHARLSDLYKIKTKTVT